MKKDASFVVSTVAMSMMLGACSYQKDEPQANAKGIAGKAVQSKSLTIETQEIPTMDPALSADAVSSRVMTNTMEGLYSLGKDDKLVPGVAKEFKSQKTVKIYIYIT